MNIFEKHGAVAIWGTEEHRENQYFRFQEKFEVDGEKALFLSICADTNYEVYINGHLVGFGQYGDYPDKKIYDTYAIGEFCKQGCNLLSVLGYSQGMDSSQRAAGIPMVKFAVYAEDETLLASSGETKVSHVAEFLTEGVERICYERPFNIAFDLRGDDGWRENYVSELWGKAVVMEDSQATYLPRPIPGLALTELCTGKVIAQGEFIPAEGETPAKQMQYAYLGHRDQWKFLNEQDGVITPQGENNFWIRDLGKETVGYYVLEVDAEEGSIIDIAFGEHLEDLRVRSYVGERNFGFRCICREGRQKIACYIHRFAGRYLQIFSHKGIRKIYTLGIQRVEYPVPFRSELKSGDRLFDRIYQVSMDTLHNCMHEHFEDGPWREQALYAGDGRNQMLSNYYAFGETAMPKASLDLLSQRRWECGLLNHIAPGSYFRTIPSFSLSWVTALKEYVLFSGDLDFAREMLPVAKGVLQFMERHMQNGVVLQPIGEEYWNFYGWMDGLMDSDGNGGKCDAMASGLFAITLKNYADLAGWIENTAEKAWATSLWEEICGAFHDCFYNKDNSAYQCFVGGDTKPHFTQITQAVAILAGLVPEGYLEKIVDALLNDTLVPIELSYLIYKYDALMTVSKDYAELIQDDIERVWGYMIYYGATSFWECSGGANDCGYAGSLCHGWSSIPIYVFWRYMMGVYPEQPGCFPGHANPVPGWERAKGALYTPQGKLTF